MPAATVVDRAGDQLGAFLPRLGGALVLLVGGLILAAILGRLVRSTLQKVGPRPARRTLAGSRPARASRPRPIARRAGRCRHPDQRHHHRHHRCPLAARPPVPQRLSERGRPVHPAALDRSVPGARRTDRRRAAAPWVERSSAQMDLPIAIGPIVQAIVVVIFGLSAALQIGVALAPLTAILGSRWSRSRRRSRWRSASARARSPAH